MIKIECVDNGWLLTDETDSDGPRRRVVETRDTASINPTKETMEAFVRLLWEVNDLIGPTTSRYSPHRVTIGLEPGDKHSSHPDNQEDAE
ncbi:MAG: hypothetical protein EBR82_65345 [Caulobacteraceae bacterium]|nr:hypothetical protein [Caulobacteraceae bacterium]